MPLDFLQYALAALISLMICGFAMPLARRLSIIDIPDTVGGRKRHARPTPLVGGIAIIIPFVLVLGWRGAEQMPGADIGLAFLTGFFLLLGFMDDRAGLRVGIRLSAAVGASTIILCQVPTLQLGYLKLSFLDEAIVLGGLAVPFTIICLVGMLNAVNMADGRNGLVTGMSLVWVLFLCCFAPSGMLALLLTLAVSLSVVLVFNMKGRLFLGDAGSYSISTGIGLLAIYCHGQNFMALPADLVATWFAVPICDCLRLIISRTSRGKSPFDGDRTHLHHLISAFMPWNQGLIVYLGLVAGPGLLGILVPQLSLLMLMLSVSLYAVVYTGLSRRIMARSAIFRPATR